LGAGESGAIGLAQSLGVGLMADDRAARRVADSLGVPVIGVLGVLVLARRLGAIPEIRPLIQALVESGYFLASTLIDEALRRVGE
jgi:predicted nucleic acid-binding protein